MRYYCNICLFDIKKKSKYSHLKSKNHKEFEKYKHKIISFKNVNIKDVDEILFFHVKDYNKKYIHYFLKGQFKLVFNDQDCKYLLTDMTNITTNVSWSNHIREAIDGCNFNHIAEMNIVTLARKRDMTYDFYLKNNMPAFEWKLNSKINKDKNLINKFPKKWRHPINTKSDCYRNKF